MESCAVAYSGGVDSSLLLTATHTVLGDRCLAVIATSSTYSRREYEQAVQYVRKLKVNHKTIVSEELDISEFKENSSDRCYYCKKELFAKIKETAEEYEIRWVADGTNADDLNDYRPGMRAASELGVRSPLKEVGLTKVEIQAISREVYNLPMAEKPSMACLASRFPYGSQINGEKLKQVEVVEDFLYSRGFFRYRARHHGDIVRIEIDPSQMAEILKGNTKEELVRLAKRQGFAYVTLDLQGYRTGSLNETLK